MRPKYLATIITPIFDEPSWMLQRNIESVMSQTVPDGTRIQHLVIVDKSNEDFDKMYDVKSFLKYFDIPFKLPYELEVFCTGKNVGLPNARNEGLKRAKGEFIFLLDTDDCMAYNDRIIDQVGFMLENNLDHSYGGYSPIHGDSKMPSEDVTMPSEDMQGSLKNMVNPCYCGSNCFRKAVLDRIGFFDGSMLDGAEDMEYWVRIAKDPILKSGCMQKVLYYLGIHSNNMTAKYIAQKRFDKAYSYMTEKHSEFFNNKQ